ncbi:MAG TPA: sensor histidine kinase [Candidatus Gemmiger faecigallinarum]|nr:sensor histidine kinase [Candidatus Gemmiger faecigallinarum]
MKIPETLARAAGRFHDLKFKQKLLFSYILVGVLPFVVFCVYLYSQTMQSIEQAAEDGFSSVFRTHVEAIQRRAERLENAIDTICMDDTVSNVATTSYTNEYMKYVDITGRFDSAIQSLMLMNPELTSYRLYMDNNLVGARRNFLPMDQIRETDFYRALGGSYQSQWFYQDGELCLAQRIYNASQLDNFAVMVLTVSADGIFSDLEDVPYRLVMQGGVMHEAGLDGGEEHYLSRSAAILGGAGTFTMYLNKSEIEKDGGDTLFAITVVVVAISILLFAAIHAFSRTFSRRIDRINGCLSGVVKNDFAVQIPVDYHDEIGTMTEYINNMIAETRHSIYDVYQSRLRQREYEIRALQAQINPHFLYNTLSAINWYALQSGDERISGIVTSLSRFYRTALNSGESLTTVRNEIENIQAYLDIQLSIHSDSFDVQYRIDPGVMAYRIPNLILQPVVENAVEHGIDHKEDGRGMLEILAEDAGGEICFQIRDNGPGMDPETLQRLLKTKKTGYGLRNVDKRLELFFGKNYELSFACDRGTCCTIRIPKKTELT